MINSSLTSGTWKDLARVRIEQSLEQFLPRRAKRRLGGMWLRREGRHVSHQSGKVPGSR